MARDDRESSRTTIEESRREVERRLDDVRDSIRREVGLRPKAKHTLLAIAAASAGFALAAGRRKRRKKRSSR